MITKLVIFDLDGVLIDSKNIHFNALNKALDEFSIGDSKYTISKQEHINEYDGLPTKRKLELLTAKKGLPSNLYEEIWDKKQFYTSLEFSKNINKDNELISYFNQLTDAGIKIAVASNSIRKTVKAVLISLGLIDYVDVFISNEDVTRNKPYPEMYWKCMTILGAIPATTVILEDSPVGKKGAMDSKANLISIDNRSDLNQSKIDRILSLFIEENNIAKWKSDSLNILIPMAGLGSRFSQQGYTFPKPLIDVRGKPMIQLVVENLNIDANYIFIVQKEHYKKYNLNYLLPLLAENVQIVQVDGLTEGAACTTLLAKEFIDNESPLLIANSDQFIEWDSTETMYKFDHEKIDAAIVTFPNKHPKWSYAKLDDHGYVIEVAEKKPISEHATVGIYYWKKGSDYIKYANEMIEKNIRVNDEFYVCPVFNQAILDNKKIIIHELDSSAMWGIGTPEDLKYFLENYKGEI